MCRRAGLTYGTTCWTHEQQAKHQTRQVSEERWANLEHQNLVKQTVLLPAVLVADAREEPYRRRPVTFCAEGARLSRVRVPPEYGRQLSGRQRRERQQKRLARMAHSPDSRPQNVCYRYLSVYCQTCYGRGVPIFF